ncbi:amino acid ABC transporter permease [Cryobacterium aureum]|uniref:amino acid ABC transporter permease n=1 Tax=Cryobacterium aureum TaxID=995037 RepID=UPI00196B4A7D|nr:amino acid ABC transporter permease [Cryobacterium aureum]
MAVLGYLGDISEAALLVLKITVLAFLLAVVLGLAAAVGRNSRFRILRFGAGVYVEVIRNTPVLLQIFVAYFALPNLGLNLNAFEAGVLALGVNVGAYLAEVFRAGISSVPKGQVEAAAILGLRSLDISIFVVFPQALRNVYPAVVNYLVQILLGTSLLSAIALPELTGTATTINSRTLIFLPVFTVTVLVYLLLSNVLAALAGIIGRVAFKPALVLPRGSVLSRMRLLKVNAVRGEVNK